MNHKNDQSVAHQAADAVDQVTDGIRSVANSVSGNVCNAAHRAVSAVEDTYDQAGQVARDTFNHSRDRVRSWENSFESSVRENPKTAVLIAGAVGALLYARWKRK